LQQIGRVLEQEFLDKQDIIRLMLLSALAGEHLLIIGPPGTAKSALVSTLSRLLSARYFEYLLTRFSEPNELLGPIDLHAFREGVYRRRSEQMLPTAEVAFLDEIFKANSAILNSLLTLLNERRLHIGSERIDVPLLALFAASNEMPSDDSLEALLDRFLVRIVSRNLESYSFHRLIEVGLRSESRGAVGTDAGALQPLLSGEELRGLQRELRGRLRFSEEFLSTYKGLIFQIRGEGVSLSDRRAVRLLKLCAASAMLDGREQADSGDLAVLRYVWNNPEQAELLDAIVLPHVERHRREHPPGVPGAHRAAANLDDLLAELGRVRDLLSHASELSDIQLFSQLRSLGALRAALASYPGETPTRLLGEIDALLEGVFASPRFC
jgi:MoxR-like ATPase